MTALLEEPPTLAPPQIVIKRKKASAPPAHFRAKAPRKWVITVTVLAVSAAITGMALYLLLPTLSSGYNGDDARNSQIPAIMQAQHQSYFDLVGHNISAWAKSSGRFFPASIAETALVFLIFSTRFAYKMFQIGIVLVDLVLLATVVAKIARSVHVGLLAAFLAVLTFQLRQFFDPIMLFSGQQQFVVAFVLLSLWSTWSAMNTGRKLPAVAACLTWTLAMTTYETTYLLLPLFLFAIAVYAKSWKSRIANALVYVVPTTALLTVVLILRANANVVSASYTPNYAWSDVSETFAKQFTAAIPLSYPSFGYNSFPTTWAWGPWLSIVGLGALAFYVLCVTMRKVTMHKRDAAVLFSMGLAMWVLPALVVSITKGWQQQVNWGAGYVSEYVGYFGFAMSASVLFTGIAQIRRIVPTFVSVFLIAALAGGTGILLGVTKQNNKVTVASWDSFRYPRDTFERSIERGLFQGMLPGSSMVSLQPGIWVDPSVIDVDGGPANIQKIDPPYTNASLPKDCKALNAECFATRGPQWVTNHTGSKDGNGVSVLGRITLGQPNSSDRAGLLSNDFYLYVESPKLANKADASVVLQTVRATGVTTAEQFDLNMTGTTRLANGDGWALWHYAGNQHIALDRITVTANGKLAGALSPF